MQQSPTRCGGTAATLVATGRGLVLKRFVQAFAAYGPGAARYVAAHLAGATAPTAAGALTSGPLGSKGNIGRCVIVPIIVAPCPNTAGLG